MPAYQNQPCPSDVKPHPDGMDTPEGRYTRHGRPSPTASASDAHEPDPNPAKHADDDGEGTSPAGHGAQGNDTHSPPAAATARTQATDRAANDPRPVPNDEARKTRSREAGMDARATASMPRAQPVNTRPWTSGSSDRRAATHAGDGDRDPETPTTGQEASN